uniref:Cesa8 n=1 Tax=Arundo donax TaxID=35708 RepID=A0A0A9FL66_ARUDO
MGVAAAAVAHLRPQHGLGDVLRVVLAARAVLQPELALQVVHAVLLLVPRHPRAPFEALVAGPALGACLRALAALVFVAGAADGEGALVAGHEGLPVEAHADVVTAYLARRLRVRPPRRAAASAATRLPADHHQLVPVVRPGHQPRARLHRRISSRREGPPLLCSRRPAGWLTCAGWHDAGTSEARGVAACAALLCSAVSCGMDGVVV